jgi:hypothetical protein
MTFFATMVYELDPLTAPDARKLLRAELAGRRWNDRFDGHLMPDCTVWIRREADPGENVDHLKAKCVRELYDAVQAVSALRPIKLVRAWVQIAGAGTWGLVLPDPKEPALAPPKAGRGT